jgi:hypothetical protein
LLHAEPEPQLRSTVVTADSSNGCEEAGLRLGNDNNSAFDAASTLCSSVGTEAAPVPPKQVPLCKLRVDGYPVVSKLSRAELQGQLQARFLSCQGDVASMRMQLKRAICSEADGTATPSSQLASGCRPAAAHPQPQSQPRAVNVLRKCLTDIELRQDSADGAILAAGTRVRIGGLIKAAHLNGRLGRVAPVAATPGRYTVVLDPRQPQQQSQQQPH